MAVITKDKTLETNELYVVGIGSSAGGIEALSLLIKNLPENLPCAYFIAQHLSPHYKNVLHEILGNETTLLVKKAVNDEIPKKNTLYIIPPNQNLVIKNKKISLLPLPEETLNHPSIDTLFESIALEYAEKSIGILLSGMGSDGTQGLSAIKMSGGITFAQEPDNAKYSSMPSTAISSEVVDYVLKPEEFGDFITRFVTFENTSAHTEELDMLLKKVKLKTNIDFSNYKHTTLSRRLERRMYATDCANLKKYLEYVDKNEEELLLFAKDTLISVTSFFRDSEAFEIFNTYVQEIVDSKANGDEIRVWVAGCATGEETYSLAILFLDHLEKVGKTCKLQVFATDINTNALSKAREGFYSEDSVIPIKNEYLNAYFRKKDSGYKVSKELRDCVIFAKQNLTFDPPFLKLDLITCRNVLIYFNSKLQTKVLNMFHYALNNGGYLFLGKSEGIGTNVDSFLTIDAKTRIFKKDFKTSSYIKKRIPETPEASLIKSLQDELSTYYENAAALVDEDLNIIHTFGHISKFIISSENSINHNLQDLIIQPFRAELISLFSVAQKYKDIRKGKEKHITQGDDKLYRLIIKPTTQSANETYMVLFENVIELQEIGANETLTPTYIRAYGYSSEDQIVNQEHLQSLIEELSISNEEMQALNEEVQASNEEMQATNEELEASNEQLQISNEELAIANGKLMLKTNELAATNFDFESVYNTLDFPLIVLDTGLNIKRFNATSARMYNLNYYSVDQHIESSHLPSFIKDLKKTLLDLINEKRNHALFVSHNKNTYKVFITPTLNKAGKVLSIVLAIVDNTDILQAKKLIEEKQEMILSIMNNASDMIALKDITGRYEFVNHRFEEFFKVQSDEILKKSDAQIFSKELASAFKLEDLNVIKEMGPRECVQQITFQDNKIWLKANRFPIFDEDGLIKSICVELQDISHTYKAEQQLKLAAKVFDKAGEGILVTDENNCILAVNEAFCKITGYCEEDAIGKNPSILNSKKHSKEFYQTLWASVLNQGWWQGEIYNKNKAGEIYSEWLTINSIKDEDNKITNYVAIFSDITAIKKSQLQIEHMAMHDELTGLPNRFCFIDQLKHDIGNATKNNEQLAVLFIDLDEFKNINDTLGHNVGDELLIEVANRLRECTKASDFTARLGGDEFTTILHNPKLNEIVTYAEKILDFITASYLIDDKKLYISCSIGISIFPHDGTDSSSLLRSADTAMYKAKDSGKKRYMFFEDEMKALSLQRMSIESGLRTALEKDFLEIYFQPKVNIHTQDIIGAEVLLRWIDPHLGIISPALFIPIAEKTGLMEDVGKVVIEKTFKALQQFKKENIAFPCMAINISPVQFREKNFEAYFIEQLKQHSINPNSITIEITESVLMDTTDRILDILNNFSALGIKISIDDFGTGYSSLSYLKKFPLSELKIDISFIKELETNMDDYHLTQAIIGIAKALNLDIVAEGVENEEQRVILCDLGCKKAQGYLFYHPLSHKDFKKLLLKATTPLDAKC